MNKFIPLVCLVVAFSAAPLHAQSSVNDAKVITEDAERFVEIFKETGGKPSADILLERYIKPGTRAIEIFTPSRIIDAENMAAKIAENPDAYRRAIDVCLPIAQEMTAELKDIYKGISNLLSIDDLPELHVIFGAGNSGGTAAPGAQVLGLEVLCRVGKGEEDIRNIFRRFFAHETIHTFQDIPADQGLGAEDYLLFAVLAEGGPDFIASVVTGQAPEASRNAWALERADYIREEFRNDRQKVLTMTPNEYWQDGSPMKRWIANAFSAPDAGWPSELGYWVGRQIWTAYYEQADDKEAVLQQMLNLNDLDVVLEKSGYLK